MAAHREGRGPELARFDLTCAVSAAHYPWMWRGAPLERISYELRELIRHTPIQGELDALQPWWTSVQRRGVALAVFEKFLRREPLLALRDYLGHWEVGPGALLWQGSWCVAEKGASLVEPHEKVPVRKLQGDETQRQCIAQYLVPVASLIEHFKAAFSAPIRVELQAIVSEVAEAYGGYGDG